MNEKSVIKTISQKYVKLSHIEHVLKRPDTYIGSIETEARDIFVVDDVDNLDSAKIVYKNINYNPGFIKLFDEVITNASDYSIRTNQVTYIKVNIDGDSISVENDGPGIPVVLHETEKVYIGELIFGNLLTSDNYDDTEDRYSAGRNGLGVKLCNIYSSKFDLEIADGKKYYHQVFTDNLSNIEKPTIKKSSKNYVRITYQPDYERFGLVGMTDEIKSVLIRRIFDIAAYIPNVKVYYNDKQVPIKSFKDYMKRFASESSIHYEKVDDFWEVGVIESPVDSFTHVSMVNGISTIVGGSHVNFVSNYLINSIKENIVKGNKGLNIKSFDIKNKMLLFINCKLINPVFDTQTKENLKLKLGSMKDFSLSEGFLKKLSKDGMFSDLIELSLLREKMQLETELSKSVSKRIRVENLVDANKAGTAESSKCQLFLTEGLSASNTAIAGFSVIGRDYNGSYPLRGKPLNVKNVSLKKVSMNDEIKDLIQILGLEFGKKYTDTKSLRYGKIVMMTDADSDGYHIKGLIINLFQTYWPELLTMNPPFINEFVTPIIIATSGKKKKMFYRVSDYEKWIGETENSTEYSIKYFKGLGTLGSQLSKELFKDLGKHLIPFIQTDAEKTKDKIELAFNRMRQDDRKVWLSDYVINSTFDKFAQSTTYESFIDNEFVEFSMEDNVRSIPSIMDGLKPSQRKIIYTLFKLDSKGEMNVGELFGYVKAKAEYHHGPTSLEQAIIGLAQDYVNSNNVPLLEPIGSFGTRLNGGKDCAAARYIYTKMSDITKTIFVKEDNSIIDYLVVDGKSVEPPFYVPIIPNVLLNGCEGIGTGWSTTIPKFKLEDLVDYIDNKLANKKKNIELLPYYEGFKGEIVHDKESNSYIAKGVITRTNTSTLSITELPIGVWNNDYYGYLDELVDNKIIKGYTKGCTDVDVNITVKIAREALDAMSDDDLLRVFDLTSKIRLTNMHLFDINGKIRKYDSQYEIIEDYYANRIGYYAKRKAYLVDKLSSSKQRYSNTIRFIDMVVGKKLVVSNTPMVELVGKLDHYKFDKVDGSYDYLLSIPIYKLTREQLDRLHQDYDKLVADLTEISEVSIEKMWHDDLVELRRAIKRMRKCA